MALLNFGLLAEQGGISIITLNFSAQRLSGTAARCQLRVVRKHATLPEAILLSAPQFAFVAERDIKSWIWFDPNIPQSGMFTYNLQIKKLEGDATFHEMVFFGQHLKR